MASKSKAKVNAQLISDETPSSGSGGNGVSFSGLDPVLGSLGVMIGLLKSTDPSTNSYELINEWFTDPITKTEAGFKANPKQVGQLLAQLLGQLGGNALGLPQSDPALLGTWYPIQIKKDGQYQPTGLYLVSIDNEKEGSTALGLGVLKKWSLPTDAPVVDVDVWALIPAVLINEDGSFGLTFTATNNVNPISIGVAVEGSEGKSPIIDENGVSFNGVKFSANLYLSDKPRFDVTLEVLALQLAGDPAPKNYSLADLEAITPQEILNTAANLFVGALSNRFPNHSDQILYFAPLFGLSQTLLEVGGVGAVNFTTASVVVNDGLRYFYPGLSFSSDPIALGSSDVVFIMEADLELAKFQLSGTPKVDLDLNFKTNFSLQNKNKETLLLDLDGYKVGSMLGGLSLGITSGNIVPYLELTNVTVPGQSGGAANADAPNEFGTVNLLSPGQLAQVATVALSGQLQDFMGLNDNPSTFVKSIASLIGLTVPESAGSNWPIKDLPPPFSVEGITDSITDPITAWANYYLNVLKYSDEIDQARAFTYILQSFASLLQIGDTSIEVSGSGTPAEPWQVGISIGEETMPAYLTAFEEAIDGNIDNGLQLSFGVLFEPLLTIDTIEIAPSLSLDALSLSFPTGKEVTAKWLNALGANLSLPKGFATPSLGGSVLSVSKAQLSGGWGQSNGWTWSMLVNQPTLKIGTAKPVTSADLNFSQQSTLQDLVKESAATFGPFFANTLGVFLMRTNTRAGLFTCATLGLLTDFSQYDIFKDSGLTWEGFTDLPLTSFADPLGLLRQQIASNFNTADKAKSQLSLLGWTLSSEATAPTIKGTGTIINPYLCPFPFGFDLPIWYDASTEIIGVQ